MLVIKYKFVVYKAELEDTKKLYYKLCFKTRPPTNLKSNYCYLSITGKERRSRSSVHRPM